MHTRYMERTNSMAREKRPLDSAAADEAQPERKRPALARYFLLLQLVIPVDTLFD